MKTGIFFLFSALLVQRIPNKYQTPGLPLALAGMVEAKCLLPFSTLFLSKIPIYSLQDVGMEAENPFSAVSLASF